MSKPILHCVQYRYMHDARHYLLCYLSKDAAVRSLQTLAQTQQFSEWLPSACAQTVIDYRNPPTEYSGHKLNIINPNQIPDVY